MDNTASKNNLLKLVRSLTQRVDQAKNENKQFRSRVNDTLQGFISPINNAKDFIENLLNNIDDLNRELRDLRENLINGEDSNSQRIIREAQQKLEEFSNDITRPNELDNTLRSLGTAVREIENTTKRNTRNRRGGGKKNKKTRRKKN
tara:strand:+ start:680 stop:1120 length:441 start_codon:yes stop_codon:yes gene_type:complete